MIDAKPATPIISIVGKSDSGKTTLIEKLIHHFIARGLKVATIKHDAHSFEVDHPGKDTWRHREAGAAAVLISSATRVFLTQNVDGPLPLEQLRDDYLNDGYDLIITEGFRRGGAAKIEVHRTQRSPTLIYEPGEPGVIAIASDAPWHLDIPCFDLNDIDAIGDFIAATLLVTR